MEALETRTTRLKFDLSLGNNKPKPSRLYQFILKINFKLSPSSGFQASGFFEYLRSKKKHTQHTKNNVDSKCGKSKRRQVLTLKSDLNVGKHVSLYQIRVGRLDTNVSVSVSVCVSAWKKPKISWDTHVAIAMPKRLILPWLYPKNKIKIKKKKRQTPKSK